MELSYWEYKTWLADTDYAIIGSGIVGLSCALHLRTQFPKAKICILEKGPLPEGASTKNAGFACFGSISEILADLESHSEEEVLTLISKRWEGIRLLKSLVPEEAMQFENLGGHEVFLTSEADLYHSCLDQLSTINTLLKPIFGQHPFKTSPNKYDFKNIAPQYLTHEFESQLNPGLMMKNLLDRVRGEGISIINGIEVTGFSEGTTGVTIQTKDFDFSARYLGIATNGFAGRLLELPLKPARAQVLITEPIADLPLKGSFHMDRGFYYFRNVDNRILIGGGRHLDFSGETTDTFGQTDTIQAALENLLREVILPNTPCSITSRWSGIMGVGPQKSPILKAVGDRTICAVRLGGMGVAIGSVVGRDLAAMFDS